MYSIFEAHIQDVYGNIESIGKIILHSESSCGGTIVYPFPRVDLFHSWSRIDTR